MFQLLKMDILRIGNDKTTLIRFLFLLFYFYLTNILNFIRFYTKKCTDHNIFNTRFGNMASISPRNENLNLLVLSWRTGVRREDCFIQSITDLLYRTLLTAIFKKQLDFHADLSSLTILSGSGIVSKQFKDSLKNKIGIYQRCFQGIYLNS